MTQTDRSEVYQHIRDEHEALRQLLGRMHQVLTERTESVTYVREMVESLQTRLTTHFREEEQDGFFDQIVEQAPRLAGQARQLCDEHAGLLEAMKAVSIVATTETGAADWWQELNKQFRHLSKELMHHEHKENELLQDAYENDIGSKD